MRLLRWESAPRGYDVVFSTRVGGVSEGPFTSLNLGLLTGDEPTRVIENRRRLAEAAGIDAETATMTRQVHGARVTEARPLGIVRPGTDYEACDGLWTDRAAQALVLQTADCLPVALARERGPRRLAALHVGWRGLLAGIVENGVRAVANGDLAAAIGPVIGACCYEVGEEVAAPFRERFGEMVVRDGRLDLARATELALRAAGVERIERSARCTACEPELFFSHRRDRGRTGRQGIVAALR